MTPALRRRIGERVAELEDAIAERRERLVALARDSATEAPTLADVAPLLDRLPLLARSLDTAPQSELRTLFDAVQLDVVYQPGDSALDVAVTLYDARQRKSPVRRTGSCGGLVGAPGRSRVSPPTAGAAEPPAGAGLIQ